MPDPEDSDLFKDIQMGELNELGFDPESPLITNSFDGESLFSGMFTKFMQKDSLFDSKTPKKAIVLLSTTVQTSGVMLESRFPELAPLQRLVNLGGLIGNTRNFAIVRIPEIHGHIPTPSLTSLVKASQEGLEGSAITDDQKMLLSMHDMCFSAPIKILGDMPSLNPGDIVRVDSDGLILELVEPAETGYWGTMLGKAAYELGFENVGRTLLEYSDSQNCADGYARTAEDILEAYGGVGDMDYDLALEIVRVSENLGLADPGWLANVINHESKFDADNYNDLCEQRNNYNIDLMNEKCAVGLIQFYPGYGQADIGLSGGEIAALSAVEQMPYVEKYFRKVIANNRPLNSQLDVYAAVFQPAALDDPTRDLGDAVEAENPGTRNMLDYAAKANKSARLRCPEDDA